VRHVPNGAGAGVDLIQFGITTWGERSHPNYPAQFIVLIDTNVDGTDDFAVLTTENGGAFVTGQNVTSVQNLATGAVTTSFFTTVDLGSANTILNLMSTALGSINPASPMRFTVLAADNYHSGLVNDSIGPMTYTLATPRFTISPSSFTLGAGGSGTLPVVHVPAGDAASPSQTGLLLLHTHALKGKEANLIPVTP
jgi:hypothetical protein